MNLIVAVDKNWGIGNNGKLLVSIPEDMIFFKKMTTGKVVVMGRKTFESLPSKNKPLKDRVNIVLTTNQSYEADGVIVVHSKEELNDEIKKYKSEDIYVIGGGDIYRLLLDECDTAYVTKIGGEYDADAFFPNLNENHDWELTEVGEERMYFDTKFCFLKYERMRNVSRDGTITINTKSFINHVNSMGGSELVGRITIVAIFEKIIDVKVSLSSLGETVWYGTMHLWKYSVSMRGVYNYPHVIVHRKSVGGAAYGMHIESDILTQFEHVSYTLESLIFLITDQVDLSLRCSGKYDGPRIFSFSIGEDGILSCKPIID